MRILSGLKHIIGHNKVNYTHFKTSIKNMSMKKKLLLSYIFVAVIPLIIIGVMSYIRSSNTIIKQTENYASLVLEQMNRDIDSYIDKIARIAYINYSNIDFQNILQFNNTDSFGKRQDNRDKMSQYLQGISTLDANIDGVYIYTKFDELYYKNSAGVIADQYSFKNESWFEEIMSGKVKSVLVPVHNEQKHLGIGSQKNFSYIIGVIDIYTNRTVGFVLIDITETVLQNILSLTENKLGGEIFILDSNKAIIFDSKKIGYSQKFEDYFNVYKSKGKYIIMENDSKYTSWKIVFISSINSLRKNVDDIRNFTVIIVVICIFTFVGLSTFISESISRPINRLKKAIKIIENGDLETTVKVESQDEIGVLSMSFNNMVTNIKRLINEVYESQLKKKEAELSALQSQINPHFMYNTLESISMMAVLAGNFNISDALTSFANILRFNLDNKKNIIPLKNELNYVIDYIKIQKIRFKDKFDVSFFNEKDIDKYKVLKLIIQPLVENAILHAFFDMDEKGKIIITTRIEEGFLNIIVEDNGVGMSEVRLADVIKSLELEEALSKEGSIGLNNINERIKLYYGNEYGLVITSKKGEGTKATIRLPVKE